MSISEKRNFDRFAADGIIYLKINPHDKIRLPLDTMSFGGCSVFSKEKLEAGKTVDFELEILGEILTGKAKIRCIREPKTSRAVLYIVGLEFTDVNKDSVAYIIKKIQRVIISKKKDSKIKKTIDFLPY